MASVAAEAITAATSVRRAQRGAGPDLEPRCVPVGPAWASPTC